MRERERSGRGGRDTRRHKSYQVYIFLRFFFLFSSLLRFIVASFLLCPRFGYLETDSDYQGDDHDDSDGHNECNDYNNIINNNNS